MSERPRCSMCGEPFRQWLEPSLGMMVHNSIIILDASVTLDVRADKIDMNYTGIPASYCAKCANLLASRASDSSHPEEPPEPVSGEEAEAKRSGE